MASPPWTRQDWCSAPAVPLIRRPSRQKTPSSVAPDLPLCHLFLLPSLQNTFLISFLARHLRRSRQALTSWRPCRWPDCGSALLDGSDFPFSQVSPISLRHFVNVRKLWCFRAIEPVLQWLFPAERATHKEEMQNGLIVVYESGGKHCSCGSVCVLLQQRVKRGST